MCSDLLMSLLACGLVQLKLVAVLVLVLFTIVFLTWCDLTPHYIVLPVSFSTLVFRLWSIFNRCIIYVRFMLASPTCPSVII